MSDLPTAGAPASAPVHDSQRIVTSAHLVSEKSPELSEFEFGLIIATHAFNRWLTRCMGAAGVKDMAAVDVLVLHHTNHRAMEKLMAAGYVRSQKKGKEVFFSTTEAGAALCMRYREVREACLMPGFSGAADENRQLGDFAKLLRTLSGRYDQAARAATSY